MLLTASTTPVVISREILACLEETPRIREVEADGPRFDRRRREAGINGGQQSQIQKRSEAQQRLFVWAKEACITEFTGKQKLLQCNPHTQLIADERVYG